jgi:hypothetical protein
LARYFFHYRNEDGNLLEDRVGSEHSCLTAVEAEAYHQAREIFEDEVLGGAHPQLPRCIEVVSEEGSEVLYLPFWATPVVPGGDLKSKVESSVTPSQ